MKQIVEVAWESLSKAGEELCGDCVEMTTTPTSLVVVLSDGLGSGVKANILATLTSRIAAVMFREGATADETLETLAETLPECQERHLAYATFAMLKVDRGRDAYLVEYDCPTLILVRAGQVVDLPLAERTVGGRQIREAHFRLQKGDYMVLVSDGYIHAGLGGLYRLGWGWENIATAVRRWAQTGGDAYELAQALKRTCLKLYDGKPGDDATAIAMRVREAVRVIIWTGPPKDPARDAEVVGRLVAAEGIKVICGGTTAQIASRVLGRRLEVEWLPPSKRQNRARKHTPPPARLEGVDLVTEGIITLGMAAELLEHARTVRDLPRDDEAATRLARVLLTADEIHFLVGMALNPNQVADLVRGEPMRMVYVKELVRLLRERNKQVIVERL